LIARAVDVAPDRPDLVWLQAQVCQQSPPCDPEPIERHLRELDPSNGERMGIAGRMRYEAGFTPEIGLSRLIGGYECAIDEWRRSHGLPE